MITVARFVAAVLGVLLLCLAAVALAREIALVAGRAFALPLAALWQPLFDQPSWTTTGTAAVVSVVVGVALLLLAVASMGRPQEKPALVSFETDRGQTSVDVPALERALRRRLEVSVPDMRVKDIELGECGTGCRLRVEADLTAEDLAGVQARTALLLRGDLERLAGLRLEALDLVADKLLLPVRR